MDDIVKLGPFASAELRKILLDLGNTEDADELDRLHSELRGWQRPERVMGNPATMSETRRVHNNVFVLKQGLLHRCTKLIEAASAMVATNNCHGLALVCRGHIEGTAQLGYFCDRLDALAKKNISFDDFHEKLALTLMGAAHPLFPSAPKPLNILTCLEKADRHLSRLFGEDQKDEVLTDSYNWLSEFCHPNFLSSASAFVHDKERQAFVFRHNTPFSQLDAQLLAYLVISAGVFSNFYTSFEELERHLPAEAE